MDLSKLKEVLKPSAEVTKDANGKATKVMLRVGCVSTDTRPESQIIDGVPTEVQVNIKHSWDHFLNQAELDRWNASDKEKAAVIHEAVLVCWKHLCDQQAIVAIQEAPKEKAEFAAPATADISGYRQSVEMRRAALAKQIKDAEASIAKLQATITAATAELAKQPQL